MRWAVEQRMNFIAETLKQKGFINRKDIMEHFGISVPQASKDLKDYQSILPDDLKYNLKLKRYEAVEWQN